MSEKATYKEFERFQRRVVECQPATFDEFEVLL